MFIVHRAHCGKLWVFEVEGQVQVTLEAKLIDILTWNFDFLNPFLFYFLLELRNPLLFVHCGCYNQSWNIRVAVWHKKVDLQLGCFNSLASSVTWTWPSTSSTLATHSLPQCALCTINISQEMGIIPSFHHLTYFFFHIISQKHDFLRFYWARVKYKKSSLISLNYGEIEKC